jgi:hypothetical protein
MITNEVNSRGRDDLITLLLRFRIIERLIRHDHANKRPPSFKDMESVINATINHLMRFDGALNDMAIRTFRILHSFLNNINIISAKRDFEINRKAIGSDFEATVES